jgi:hypothetical protein
MNWRDKAVAFVLSIAMIFFGLLLLYIESNWLLDVTLRLAVGLAAIPLWLWETILCLWEITLRLLTVTFRLLLVVGGVALTSLGGFLLWNYCFGPLLLTSAQRIRRVLDVRFRG